MNEDLVGTIRRMNENDLDQVLTWRNNPEVRRYMYSQHEIERTEHANWYAAACLDPTKHLLVFELGEAACGFISLNETAHRGVANWGFYLAPNSQKGAGQALGKAALKYGFEVCKFHKLCGEVLGFNERSIRFHQGLGFQREGTLRQQHFDGQQYQDIVCFGLLASEWNQPN